MSSTKLASEFDHANDSPGLLLWQLSNKWQARQRAALKPFGLTHVQFVLLATLTYTAGEHSFTQKQLAEYAQTDVMMTSQVIRKLEQKGLVLRELSKQDGRAFTVHPTPAGITLVNKAVKAVEAVDKAFFSAAGTELALLTNIMRQLVDP
jgi:DNA-binding MarR family transcriptional regulator